MSDQIEEVLEDEDEDLGTEGGVGLGEDEGVEGEDGEEGEYDISYDEEMNTLPDNENIFGLWNRDTVGIKRLKVLLYGTAGSGKTTMAATFPAPLFLDLEGGMRSTLLVGDVHRYPADHDKDITSYREVVQFYNAVRTYKNPFWKTIVIDSLNELQTHVTNNVVSRFDKVKRQYNDQLTLADYGKANRDYAKVVRLFLRLPFHIVFIAAATKREVGDEETQITPKFVGRQVGPDVERMMDMIGYLYTKKVENKDTHLASFKHSPGYLAKDRLRTISREFPNNFTDLIRNIQVYKDLDPSQF